MERLWMIIARLGGTRMLSIWTAEAVTEIEQEFSRSHYTALKIEEMDEIIDTFNHGPTIKAPPRVDQVPLLNEHNHSIIETHLIQQPPYSMPSQTFGVSNLFPQYPKSPVLYASSVLEFLGWEQHSKALTRSDHMSLFVRNPYVWKHVCEHDRRACRLELYFLNRWRMSVELRVRRLPKSCNRAWQEITEEE